MISIDAMMSAAEGHMAADTSRHAIPARASTGGGDELAPMLAQSPPSGTCD